MSNELKKVSSRPIDGFDGFEEGTENDEQAQSHNPIRGTRRIKFNDATWPTVDDEEIAADREFIAINVDRVVQKFVDGQAADTIVLAPGEKFSDLKKLNEAAPREEWGENFNGQPRGPWIAQNIVYLLDPVSMERFAFPANTATIGSTIAVRDLVSCTKWKRRLLGENVYAVVRLADVFMPTRFGGRQRPHFVIKRWVRFGSDGTTQALPAPTNPTLPPSDTKETLDRFANQGEPKKEDPSGLRTVEPPSVREDLEDEIPF